MPSGFCLIEEVGLPKQYGGFPEEIAVAHFPEAVTLVLGQHIPDLLAILPHHIHHLDRFA